MRTPLFTTTLTVLMGLLLSPALAQECITEKDPFTGLDRKEFIYSYFNVQHLKMEVAEGGLVIMTYRHAQPYVVDVTIPAGSPFLLKLRNDQILELEIMEDATTRTGSSGGRAYSECFFKIAISRVQLEMLAAFPITTMRHPDLDGKVLSIEKVNSKFVKIIRKGAKCML